ncbi:hypothetical protein M3Y97_00991400 [Aphelenchoides bicaudatus]|nr:hypothetical protein M3Y97_00991400 [Aphelenchoides bicaudatus]
MIHSNLLKWLLMLFGAFWFVQVATAISTHRHLRRQALRDNEDTDEGEDEEVRGNGFEFEGLKGHGGLFSAFNWTSAELAKVSMWHATAQHYKAAELVEEKLAALDPHQKFPREEVRSFLVKFRTPDAVRQMFDNQQIRRIRILHYRHRIDEINQIFYDRLMQLDPMVRREIMDYFTLPHRC